MLSVAIEGPSCAGKSTLLSHLATLLESYSPAILPDYVDSAGGESVIPAPAESVAEDLESLFFYFDVDRRRWDRGVSGTPQVILMDRSPHTLLAHEIYMEERLSASGLLSRAKEYSDSNPVNWPDFVIFLRVSQPELERRFFARHGEGESVFVTESYNRLFKSYFDADFFEKHAALEIDGESSPMELAHMARDIILTMLTDG